jgi:hypothetical protein
MPSGSRCRAFAEIASSSMAVPGSDRRHRPAAMPPDIRWQQRFDNFCQALDPLETFFQPPLSMSGNVRA